MLQYCAISNSPAETAREKADAGPARDRNAEGQGSRAVTARQKTGMMSSGSMSAETSTPSMSTSGMAGNSIPGVPGMFHQHPPPRRLAATLGENSRAACTCVHPYPPLAAVGYRCPGLAQDGAEPSEAGANPALSRNGDAPRCSS